MPKPLKFSQRLDRYPPILVRLLTTWGRGAKAWMPSDAQIAKAGGLSMADVKRLAYSTSWAGIPIDLIDRYLAGCKVDLQNRREFGRLEYMRLQGTFEHARRSPLWDGYLSELFDLWTLGAQQ